MVIAWKELENGRRLMLVGLSLENVARLIAGRPILINRERQGDLAPEGLELAICVGATEDSIGESLKNLIGPTTLVVDMRKPETPSA